MARSGTTRSSGPATPSQPRRSPWPFQASQQHRRRRGGPYPFELAHTAHQQPPDGLTGTAPGQAFPAQHTHDKRAHAGSGCGYAAAMRSPEPTGSLPCAPFSRPEARPPAYAGGGDPEHDPSQRGRRRRHGQANPGTGTAEGVIASLMPVSRAWACPRRCRAAVGARLLRAARRTTRYAGAPLRCALRCAPRWPPFALESSRRTSGTTGATP